jgi:hypothetical protein
MRVEGVEDGAIEAGVADAFSGVKVAREQAEGSEE